MTNHTTILRDALTALHDMTSRYAISDTDYGIVCNAAAALAAADATDQGRDSAPYAEAKERVSRYLGARAKWGASSGDHIHGYSDASLFASDIAALAARPAPIGAVAPDATAREQRFASWIMINRPEFFQDHACARCVPDGDILVSGFTCTYHEAVDVVGGKATAPAAPIAEVTGPMYTVGPTRCDCHPETCCCWDFTVYSPDGKRHSTYLGETIAKQVADALNATSPVTSPLLDTIEREPKLLAWVEPDGDEWHVHEADSDLGKHISEHQKDAHYASVFPVFDGPTIKQSVAVDGAPSTNSAAGRLLKAAKTYFDHYVQDEADPGYGPDDLVCSVEQHEHAKELAAAITTMQQGTTPKEST